MHWKKKVPRPTSSLQLMDVTSPEEANKLAQSGRVVEK
jgi:hypothetical protein